MSDSAVILNQSLLKILKSKNRTLNQDQIEEKARKYINN